MEKQPFNFKYASPSWGIYRSRNMTCRFKSNSLASSPHVSRCLGRISPSNFGHKNIFWPQEPLWKQPLPFFPWPPYHHHVIVVRIDHQSCTIWGSFRCSNEGLSGNHLKKKDIILFTLFTSRHPCVSLVMDISNQYEKRLTMLLSQRSLLGESEICHKRHQVLQICSHCKYNFSSLVFPLVPS